jgi:PadR family transcriptional regulator, regulatory protein PadR
MVRTANASRQTRQLLSTLSAEPRTWRHGYDLSKQTGLKSGTLYPLLMRLCDQGLLDSKWQETEGAGRPPRHLYRLSTRGMAVARQVAARSEDATFPGDPARVKA